MTRSLRAFVGYAALLVVASACIAPAASQSTSPAPPEAQVTVELFQFKPDRLEVKVGTRVVWTNQDDVTHTVTSGVPERPSGLFDGRLEGKGSTFSMTFDRPGTYPYFCARHEHMRGEVVVTP